MECYKLVEGVLRLVEDPAGVVPGLATGAFLQLAGYVKQRRSGEPNEPERTVDVYKTRRPGLPTYYVPVSGPGGCILAVVADSAEELITALRHLRELLARRLAGGPAPRCGAARASSPQALRRSVHRGRIGGCQPPGAPPAPIGDPLRRFVLTSLRSIEHLRAVLLVRAQPARAWSAGDFAAELGVDERARAEQLLQALVQAGVARKDDRGAFTYAPASPELEGLLESLARAQRESPAALALLVTPAGTRDLTAFSEAFRIRRPTKP